MKRSGHNAAKASPVPEVSQSSAGGPDGYLFTSVDGRQVVQARLDGFTFSRLKPYDKWESLRDEARELWQHYVQIASPETVTRVALRYINVKYQWEPIARFVNRLHSLGHDRNCLGLRIWDDQPHEKAA